MKKIIVLIPVLLFAALGFIDTRGKEVIAPKYESIYEILSKLN